MDINYTKYILISLFFVLLSCLEKETTYTICDTTDPLKNIGWLKSIKKEFEKDQTNSNQQIVFYKYKGKDVFKIVGLQLSNDHPILVYDCEQNIICSLGGILGSHPCPDFVKNATHETILFEK